MFLLDDIALAILLILTASAFTDMAGFICSIDFIAGEVMLGIRISDIAALFAFDVAALGEIMLSP